MITDPISDRERHILQPIIFLSIILLSIISPYTLSWAKPASNDLSVGIESVLGFDAIHSISTISTAIVANAIMEPLFYLDENGDLIPALALSIHVSQDKKKWTVTLRKSVTFHDGTPFNADAVVAHWMRILDPRNRFRGRNYITPVLSVKKVDAHNVTFHLKHPWPPFKAVLAWNRSYISLIPSPTAVANKIQNRKPSGTGPYRFVQWKQSDYVLVEKNPNHWKVKKPAIDMIKFRIIPDHQTRYAALQAGELDLIYTDRGGHIVKAQNDSAFKVFYANDNGAETIVVNNATPPLNDVRVRKALLFAWNQARYIALSYKDTIPIISDPFGGRIQCGDSNYLAYDPETARALIAEYGKPVRIEYLHTNSKRGRDAGQILHQMCKAVGIELTLTALDIGPIVQKVIQGDYQISSWRISSAPDQGPALYLHYHSQSASNYSNYASSEMDELLEKQRRESDPETRAEILCQIAARINSEAVTLYRGGRRYHFIAQTSITGLGRIIQGVPFFDSVSNIK